MTMGFIEEIENCVPRAPDAGIPWSRIERLLGPAWIGGMKTTLQNPVFHGEGDVYTHTQMVCGELIRGASFFRLPDRQRTELFLAAILHDIGKVKTTRPGNGSWVSPYHASVGSRMVRTFLWQDCGICGSREMLNFRETVCALVLWHMLPVHLADQDQPERTARTVAATGELAEDFSWRLLCMLAEADVRGRKADDIEDGLTQVELARITAEEAECPLSPYRFADSFTKRAYLSGRSVCPDQPLYDDTWGEVIMLSGLPGTGKDTWIALQHPDRPTVSLDGLRAELGIGPAGPQGKVIQAARERAREYLRKKQPFIWNATNLTRDTRAGLTALFERYGASVRIVYLETGARTREERNAGRPDAVPEGKTAGMLEKTVPPTPDEARRVVWQCI